MIDPKVVKKIYNLCCDYCNKLFSSRQSKSRHITMNRCPEIKKSIANGDMEPHTKKHKVTHESDKASNPPVNER